MLLGRGWVKAGYDFGSFTQNNFRYNKTAGRVDLIGMKATILNKAINPWFIPEKGIPGFEILIAKRKAKRDASVLLEVKQQCLNQLVIDAYDAQILEKARANAIENLEVFFFCFIKTRDKSIHL